ncbi:MAG TPA: hypothetical protein DEB06_03270 [Phycisphaerales bacterium]|nr:hypothetical protein [Phycisphaerales bacterium]
MGRNTIGWGVCALCLGAISLVQPSAEALIVVGGSLPRPDGAWVGRWNGSSGVAIGSRWVVSAGHVRGGAGSLFVMDGVSYPAKAVYFATGADLMLIELHDTLPGWHVIADSLVPGTRVQMNGFGLVNGTVLAAGIQWGTTTAESWGENILDIVAPSYVSSRFDRLSNGGLPAECAAATFDSGGGMFVRTESGSLRLVGIITSVDGSVGVTSYGNRTYGVNMTTQTAFVAGVVGPPCDGDANGDGIVDSDDITTVLEHWGEVVDPHTPGDTNGSGFVDFEDIMTVLWNWLELCE